MTMDEDSPRPRSNPTTAIIVAVLLGIALYLVVPYMVQSRRPGSATIGAWETRQFPGMTLKAPFAFERWHELEDKLRPTLQATMDEFHFFRAGNNAKNPAATVSCLACKLEFTPSLDGAVKGAIEGAGKEIGDTNPQVTIKSLTVEGYPARRVSYPKAHLESLFICNGQVTWHIQVTSGVSLSSAEVERILDSVHPQ